MTRNELKQHLIENYTYVHEGNIDVKQGLTNSGYPCFIVDNLYFTCDEWYRFLQEINEEHQKWIQK